MDASATYRAPSPFDVDQLSSCDPSLVKVKLFERAEKESKRRIALFVCVLSFVLLATFLLNYFVLSNKLWNFEQRLSGLIEPSLEHNSAKSSERNETNERIKESAKEALEEIVKLARNLNDTNQRLEKFAKEASDRQKEILRQNGSETNEANLAVTSAERGLQKVNFSTNCTQATNLTRLSNGKKYFFSYPNKANWSEADGKCKAMGLHLATIRDEADLNATIAEATKRNQNYSWLSGTNYGFGGKYDVRWHDGSELAQNSPLWNADATKLWDCVYSSTVANEKLDGLMCTVIAYYICELPTTCY
ncbi:uncharacterized protein LOC132197059 isoform X2 [Neocloeon triangulifer]|uniref:uncharacterized protein LOC132197059 isoform X2 n=1 Tax=Neocloeon triangulifer TaxID=2078957 RepID=UPI00286F4CE4|nr:uncharacterized protein LOC132197059 isoform X2 [Neocloeon triangulifer]